MKRFCPRHRVPLLEAGDELRCPVAPHEVRSWLVVDDRRVVWAAATRRRVYLTFDVDWSIPKEPPRILEPYPPAA